MKIERRIAIENQVVRKLIRVAKAHGYELRRVFDGEEMVKTTTEKTAMEAVFSVDESCIYFKREDQPKCHCAVIILGNDGWDAIADASVGEGWDQVMQEVWHYCERIGESIS